MGIQEWRRARRDGQGWRRADLAARKLSGGIGGEDIEFIDVGRDAHAFGASGEFDHADSISLIRGGARMSVMERLQGESRVILW